MEQSTSVDDGDRQHNKQQHCEDADYTSSTTGEVRKIQSVENHYKLKSDTSA